MLANPTEEVRPQVATAAVLYPDLVPELQRYLARIGVWAHDIDDVVAETFAALLDMSDERFDEIDNVRAYLFVVARHLGYRRLRTRARLVPVPDEDLDTAVLDDDTVVRVESAALSGAAFEALPDAQRELLWMSAVERRSSRAIAESLGITVSNVTTQAQRARAALKQAYLIEFLQLTPRPCDFDLTTLARFILGTASRRQERHVHRHLPGCFHCSALVNEATEEMRRGSVHGIAVVGAVAAGWLGRRRTARSPLAGTPARDPRTGARRLLTAVVGAVLVLLTPALTIYDALAPQSALSPLSLCCSGAPRVDISARPAIQTVAMPAPGEQTGWTMRVRNQSRGAVTLAVRLDLHKVHASDEEPLLAFRTKAGVIRAPTPGSEYSGKLLYVGDLPGGEEIGVSGAAIRRRTDVDQSLTSRMTVQFVAGMDVADGTRPGDLIDDGRGATHLPDTGMPVTLGALALAILSLVAGGTLLRMSARARPRRRGGAAGPPDRAD